MSAAFISIASGRAARIWWSPRTGGDGLTLSDVDALLAIPDDTHCLEDAYLAILRRLPDPTGMAAHHGALEGGATRLERLIGLANSAEGRAQPGAGETLASLRATQTGDLLAQLGSEVKRHHLLASRELEDLWDALWVDAARQTLPFILRTPDDLTEFHTAIRAGGDPLVAFLAAWRSATANLPSIQRLVGRIRMRLTWRRTWALVEQRFHTLIAASASLASFINAATVVADA
jgi:hypothetical protein